MKLPPGRSTGLAIPGFFSRLDRLGTGAAMILCCALWAVVFCIDWTAAARIAFGPYYLIPIALSAWCLPLGFTAGLVVAASVARTVVLSRLLPPGSTLYFGLDVLSFLCIYAGVVWLLGRLRQAYRMLADEATSLATRVDQAERRSWLDASIRRAVLADVERIVQLVALGGADGDLSQDVTTTVRQAALSGVYADSIRSGTGPRPTWTNQRAIVPIEFWVSQINDQIAGFFMVMGLDDKQGAERELHAIVTDKDYRGVGVATAMVDFFCSHYSGRKLYAAVKAESIMHQMLKRRGFFHHANASDGYQFVERVEWPEAKGLLKAGA